jgi:hypothetical protein
MIRGLGPASARDDDTIGTQRQLINQRTSRSRVNNIPTVHKVPENPVKHLHSNKVPPNGTHVAPL